MKNYTHIFINAIICLFLILLIKPTKLFAQGQFVEGYILTSQRDTIRGSVRDGNWAASPRRVEFKSAGEEVWTYSAEDLVGFGLVTAKEVYKSRKIGLLDISSTHTYTYSPSFAARDSVQVFLQELVSGGRATLFELLDRSEHAHFFIEKDGQLKELLYYPFYKLVREKTYLLVYDEYKKQLDRLCGDSKDFKEPMPPYQEKYLKQYIEVYNDSFTKDSTRYQAKSPRPTFDLELSAGVENWQEGSLRINSKATYGFGCRVNFPRRFRNRYARASILLTPGIRTDASLNSWETETATIIEVGVGRHIGSGSIRPYFGLNASFVNRGYRADFLGLHAGISYKRLISFEVGHFANFYCLLTRSSFMITPSVSLHYFVNLSLKQDRMR
ncbi:hypothetical protein LZD49_24650 [Dyadobacter sp. CY261]|uniref:hypothetical protein n=1 Tax=Dyadobacter sp. CY261 TaxID=2907203 RepID=UPI001F164D7D|nr:hypothetical protein [Dyadobacter sp. CY261]MCF0073692.1 hypothetical protein [Dyadobacter sp. CY261]